MKTPLLTLALVALTTVATHAQGTIAFGNSALTRIQIKEGPFGPLRNATAADGLIIGVFFGAPGSALTQAPGEAGISATTPGVMVNAPSVFALPNTEPGQVVSLQIRVWDNAGLIDREISMTEIRQVTLAPTAGPGTVIWQTATGTNPNRFTPLVLLGIPEPSAITLLVLGLGSLLLVRRRKALR